MTTPVDVRAELLAELQARTSAPVIAAFAAALGVDPALPGDPAAHFPPVTAWWVSYGSDVLAIYALSARRVVRYELTTDGRSLTVCLPLSRVARIAEEVNPGGVSVLIEMDADRRVIQISGNLNDAGDNDPVQLRADLLAAAMVLNAPAGEDAAKLLRFGARLRAALAS